MVMTQDVRKVALDAIVEILNGLSQGDRSHVLACIHDGVVVYRKDGTPEFQAGPDKYEEQRKEAGIAAGAQLLKENESMAKLNSRDDYSPEIRDETIRFLESKSKKPLSDQQLLSDGFLRSR